MPRTRKSGEAIALLHEAAKATTSECIDLTGYSRRPHFRCGDGKWGAASRAVWVIANGDPGAAFVLHTCHRGWEGCINIKHLYLGDRAQNTADMVASGRQIRGASHPSTKLTDADVARIRERYAAGGVLQRELAVEYGMTQTNISRLVRGATFRGVK